ncbi:uncharacterized protein TNCV_1569521 [Trichonephila clavipes]|uniref:Uncharacterized protein n=1 Tax=Trichonephila clavipes TaxID=2585209 RepID=A0A8X6SK17_TRICX|nr:uncharacterized protein TNCV_1569521 [Trichonephila clavipes]
MDWPWRSSSLASPIARPFLSGLFLLGANEILGSGCSSLVVKVSDRGWHVTSSSPVPLKTRRVGQLCTLNLSRAKKSSRWCGVVVRRGGASSDVVLVTLPWFKITRSVAKSSRVAEQCDVNIHSLAREHRLNRRQFASFLEDKISEYDDQPYYTEVQWLSNHKVLKRFFKLFKWLDETTNLWETKIMNVLNQKRWTMYKGHLFLCLYYKSS